MKNLLTVTACLLLIGSATAQSKMLEKAMAKAAAATALPEMEFFLEESMTTAVTEIPEGTFEIWVKAPIKKSLTMKTGNHTRVDIRVRWSAASRATREIYKEVVDLGKTLGKYYKESEYLSFYVNFKDKEKTGLFDIFVQDAEKEIVTLEFEVGGGSNRTTDLSRGNLTLDLTNGNDNYMAYFMGQQADYTFEGEDAIKDDELKAEMIDWFKNTRSVDITNFAWGERVPYTENGENIRRYSAGVTYQDMETQKCYSAFLSMFTGTPYPRTDYKFDGETAYLNNSTQVPCDRIGK